MKKLLSGIRKILAVFITLIGYQSCTQIVQHQSSSAYDLGIGFAVTCFCISAWLFLYESD